LVNYYIVGLSIKIFACVKKNSTSWYCSFKYYD